MLTSVRPGESLDEYRRRVVRDLDLSPEVPPLAPLTPDALAHANEVGEAWNLGGSLERALAALSRR